MAERLRPGLIMGRDLARPGAWIPLIRGGTRLTPEVIERVRSLGLEDEALDCVDWNARCTGTDRGGEEDGLTAGRPHRAAAAGSVRGVAGPAPFLQDHEIAILHDALQGNCLPEVVRQVVKGIARRMDVAKTVPEYRLSGVHLLRHPLNVMTLCTVIGHSLGFAPEQLFTLATGALLHEKAPGDLDGNVGLARLAAVGNVRETIQAFTNWHQGTGPLSPPTANRPPHPAEVLAVADVYDTMLADRPDTVRMPPGIAFNSLQAMAGRRLETRTVQAFCRHVLPYPPGTHVLLNDRRRARVASATPDQPLRPVVEVEGEGESIDLAATKGLEIADIHVIRREERVSLCLPVRVRLDDGELAWAILVDVSDHGVCIELDGRIPAAAKAELELTAPYRASLRLRAVVCWQRETQQDTTRVGMYVPKGGLRRAARMFSEWAS